ncbi:DUF6527 family protein [Mycolicibacterium sp. Dal123E01]|uniref:DUF6527 family protein n=1 Tax=Mycolicibacterium sp. Dal123E01 TaxID=3457578 RepID=UPI00403E7E5F
MTRPRRLPRWLRRWRQLLKALASRPVTLQDEVISSVFDVPTEFIRRTAVLVAKGDVEQWLIFDCPCRAGHRVMLNLDPTSRPAWRIIDRQRLTLRPSVDEITESGRCHYFINKGKVIWV